MDWNVRKTKDFEIPGAYWTPQVTSPVGGFSQANVSTPNFCNSSGNNQITNAPSSIKHILTNNSPFRSSNVPKPLKRLVPKLSVSDKNFGLKNNFYSLSPPSLSVVTVQMATNDQNPNLSRNVDISSSVTLQGSSVSSMQNIHQRPMNPYIVRDSFSNQVLQNCSNSMRTVVYQQAPPNSSSLKRPPVLITNCYMNGPATSQTDARVPFNSTSSHYLTPPPPYPSANNGPNPGIPTTVQSQLCTPDHINPALYKIYSHSESRNTAQTTNINSSTLDLMPPVQGNHGQYVLQPTANMTNEKVLSYPPVRVQNSNLYSVPPEQKCQSLSSATNTNEVGITAFFGGPKATICLPDKLAQGFVEAENNHSNNISTTGTIHPAGPSPQTSTTLQQKNSISNILGDFSDNFSNDAFRNKLMLYFSTMSENDLLKLKKNITLKQNCRLALQKKQASDTSMHNQNSNLLCPPCNTNPSLVHNTQQVPSDEVIPNQFSSNSPSSSQIKDVSLVSQKTKEHLLPILWNMLKGTADENMIFSAEVEGDKNKCMNVQDNSSFDSSGSTSENHVNVDRTARLNYKTSATQETSINYSSFEQFFNSADSQLEKIPGTNKDGLFNNFKQNKSSVDGVGQYLSGNIQSSVQNPTAAQGSSLPVKKSVKEESEKLDCSTSACMIQHNENTSLKKTWNGEITNVSSSSFPVSKVAEAITGTQLRAENTCSLEALKTSLALWRKSNQASFTSQLNTDSSYDGKETVQILENLSNTLNQNYDTKTTVERTPTYMASSFGKNLDGVSSNLPKGYEPQVAIVTPLILSKTGIQDEVQKNNLSLLEVKYPFIKDGGVHSSEERVSAKPDTDKEEKRIVCSSTDLCKYEDLNMHQETNKSPENNDIAKVEAGTNCLSGLNQEISNNAPLKFKQRKLNSGDISHLSTPPQKCVTSKKCDEPDNTAEIVLNDSMFQISTVCTLVQGDACYNSQIANIFNSSPSKSNSKVDISEEHIPYIQHNEEQSGLLKNDPETRSFSEEEILLPSSGRLSKAFAGKPKDFQIPTEPQSTETSIETNMKNSEEQKNNDLLEGSPHSEKKLEQDISYSCNTDLPNNEVLENQKGLFSTSFTNIVPADRKEFALEHILGEDKPAYSGSNNETSLTLLHNQLTELSKEFPYGIGYLNMAKGMESKDSVSVLTEKDGKEDTRTYEESLDPCGTIDQIKIEILNSQQMKEVFPDYSQQSSDKLEKHGDDQMITDPKDNLRKDNVHYMKSNPGNDVDNRSTQLERTGKTKERTYCCLAGWIASGYKVGPCSCMLAKESSLKQKTSLDSQSKDNPTFRDNEGDCRLKNEVKTSILDENNNAVFSGDPSCKVLDKTSGLRETDLQVKENKPPKVDEVAVPLLLVKTLKLQKPNEQVIRELLRSADSQSPQRQMAGMNKTYNQIPGRKNISKGQERYHSSTDFKKIIAKKFRKMKSEKKPFDRIVKSKSDTGHHRQIETKYSTNYERYKIKRDTNETRMIKGPVSSLSLKRQLAKEKKRKALEIQPSDAIPTSALSCVNVVSENHNSEHNSSLHSQEDLIKKLQQRRDLEKCYGYRKVPYSESFCPKNIERVSEKPVKIINLEKYAYSKDRKNAWKYRSSHLETRSPTSQKEKGPPSNIYKTHSPGREGILDGNSKNKRPERSFSDKCFKRRNSLSIFLQKEQKNYLNRVAFKRTAQKTICLTSLESSHSKSDWGVKPSGVSGGLDDNKKSSLSSQKPEAERPQMLEFKMCPDILFPKSVSEEHVSEAEKLPDRSRMSVTEVKSKREDWLNYSPVKRRKTEENEAKVDDDIPLDTAIKLLEGNELSHLPVKDSKATFETYRKMHLEKRSRSLDGSPST